MKTKSAKAAEVDRRWFVVDAKDKVLGRLATKVATVLRGKHKPIYTPHTDTGDFVVVINAAEVRLTGNKEEGKIYHRHTGWAGGLVSRPAHVIRQRKPTQMVEDAVWGMLPKGAMGRAMYRKLKVYPGAEHPHAGQNPEVLAV